MSDVTFKSRIEAVPSFVGKVVVATIFTAQLAAIPVYASTTDAVRLNTPTEAIAVLWADGSGILWADGSRMVY